MSLSTCALPDVQSTVNSAYREQCSLNDLNFAITSRSPGGKTFSRSYALRVSQSRENQLLQNHASFLLDTKEFQISKYQNIANGMSE